MFGFFVSNRDSSEQFYKSVRMSSSTLLGIKKVHEILDARRLGG
jgi:hypothetical protein